MINVRAATADDVTSWCDLRRDGIARFPEAFRMSLADHDQMPADKVAKDLQDGSHFICFKDTTLVGMIALYKHNHITSSHRGHVFGFYVVPSAQGTGIADALMQAIFARARQIGIWQLELVVNEENNRAIGFYTRLGFNRIGRIPNAMIGSRGPEHDLSFAMQLPRDTTPA